jgi:hypothetical protein
MNTLSPLSFLIGVISTRSPHSLSTLPGKIPPRLPGNLGLHFGTMYTPMHTCVPLVIQTSFPSSSGNHSYFSVPPSSLLSTWTQFTSSNFFYFPFILIFVIFIFSSISVLFRPLVILFSFTIVFPYVHWSTLISSPPLSHHVASIYLCDL